MANCFWVGGTASWDGTNTGGGGTGGIKWASASGGTVAASGGGTGGSPGAADIAIFDASSGGGTVTATSAINGTTISGLTTGAFTGTLDFATNNISLTINGSWDNNGSGVRTINLGTGTFSFTSTNSSVGMLWGTTTNLTLSGASATFSFTGATINQRLITFGNTALAYPTINIGANASGGCWSLSGTNITSIAAMTIASPNTIQLGNNTTFPIGTLSFSGGSASALLDLRSNSVITQATISSANAMSGSWAAVRCIAFAGGGNATFTNSYDLLRNSIAGGGALSITQPSAGNAGVGVIG